MPSPDVEATRSWLDALERSRAERRARRSRQLLRAVILVVVGSAAIFMTIAVYEVGASSNWFLPAR